MPGERWRKDELEALQWLLNRKEQLRSECRSRGEIWDPESWSWEAIANKMTRTARRDEWPELRKYTGKVCYTAYRKRQSLLAAIAPVHQEYPAPLPAASPSSGPTSPSPSLPGLGDMQTPVNNASASSGSGARDNLDRQQAIQHGYPGPSQPSRLPSAIPAPLPPVTVPQRKFHNPYGFVTQYTAPQQPAPVTTNSVSVQYVDDVGSRVPATGGRSARHPLPSHSGRSASSMGPHNAQAASTPQRRQQMNFAAPAAVPHHRSQSRHSMQMSGPAVPAAFGSAAGQAQGSTQQHQSNQNGSNNVNHHIPPEPPYHWTPMERDALKDLYLYSGIGLPSNFVHDRRKGTWTWRMVAEEMNRRAVGASWNVGRIYNDGSCHQMGKYNKADWDACYRERPPGATVQPLDEDDFE
ncbi:uncharacterized protein L3040_006345 [Drepanopeziza brunnea f. sp. 'multigermtubi']|uniref:Uncharacterized protein n=1 Tax=Marssonina brunnea f. sp. multigermtubi (strain MB_m1) TaxID=1072389 RepID=K1WSP0_MARBU|nr:uncharacterized protein MBM_01302 [Drepanopeziza brunnea f. sp. 'multigermtubi' MB_m1]EKD20620.1 hypothetical protein MBM_01302 [Drepanopeziza brunnea f. sp. 'multigermtubi' MB_m1]KAJ5038665.1 hypothetical protein L3040_006345 [Drepanopeziza brunnea f. sp. 'multigermtubi']